MSATTVGAVGTLSPDGAAGHDADRGRLTYAEKVYTKVAEQVTAQAIGVPRRDVAVAVAQYRDGVALRVAAPLPVPSLDDTDAISSGPPVLDRVSALQQNLKDEVGRMLGREVIRVDMTVTGAVIARRRRLR